MEEDTTGSFPLRISSASALRIKSEASTRSITDRVSESSSKKKSSSRKSVAVNSNFIKAKTKGLDAGDGTGLCGKIKTASAAILQNKFYTNAMALVVLADAYCTCWDIDARAAQVDAGWIPSTMSDVCLALYTMELAMSFLVSGVVLCKDWVVQIDLFVVICGYVEAILSELVARWIESFTVLRVLRIMRIIRLSRLLRKTRALRELQKLVRMMATCLRALMWSFVFCFMIMTIWAMLIVEWIHPCVLSLQSKFGTFDDCEQCLRATSSVMDANLLLFKTVIAGDSWGLIAVPVIEEYPLSALIFMGSLLTLVFGVLNLIVAVVVDNFAEARQRDVLNLAEEMEDNLDKDTKLLEAIFDRIDEDASGQVTFEELVEGARNDKEFQSRLRVMDIDEADLQQLFEMIDTTGEGSIEKSQFIAPMTRWVHDSKTAPRFIKYNMLRTLHHQEEFFSLTHECLENLSDRVDCIAQKLGLEVRCEEEHNLTGEFQTRKWSPRVSSLGPAISPTVSIGSQGQRSWNLSPRRNQQGPGTSSLTGFSFRCPRREDSGAPRQDASKDRWDALDQMEKQDSEKIALEEKVLDTEGVVQPHRSTTMPFPKVATEPTKEDGSLKVAMQKLESLVVDATRSAVKASLDAVEIALQEGRRSGGRGDNIAGLLHLFENLHSLQQVPRNDGNSPEYPRHHGFLQRRGTDEGSLLSRGLRRGSKEIKEEASTSMNFPCRVQSQEDFPGRIRRNSTNLTNISDQHVPYWLRRVSRHSHGGSSPGPNPSGRPLIGGFGPPTGSLQTGSFQRPEKSRRTSS